MGMYDANYSFYTQPSGYAPVDPDKNTYVAIWDLIFSYNQNMIVAYNGIVYRSLVNNNLGNQPDISPLKWEAISGYLDREPYHDNFSVADWAIDVMNGGFYIDYPATTHLQGADKNVYAFVSEDGVPSEQPLGYGDFLQNDLGNIRILTDIAFDGFVTITRFASIPSGGGGTNNYDDLINKPELDTTATASLPTSPNEVIQGNINLHKISKTGEYSDLNNIPADLYQQGTDLTIKVYSQNNMPAMTTNNTLAIWIDTTPGNGNHVYLIFRRGAGDVVAVDLT